MGNRNSRASSSRTLATSAASSSSPSAAVHRPCHMSLLHAVETQLVMQWLDVSSKLSLARCNRRLHRDADHPFAWIASSDSLIQVRRTGPDLAQMIQASLLRHAPLELRWSSLRDDVGGVPAMRGLRACASAASSFRAYDFASLLQQLPAGQLRSLMLEDSCAAQKWLLDAVCRDAQGLTTLSLCAQPDPHFLAALPSLPALTDLRVALPASDECEQGLLRSISECLSLRRLTLPNRAQWRLKSLAASFLADRTAADGSSLPSLAASLEVLSLDAGDYLMSGNAEAMNAWWSAFQHLHTLTISKQSVAVDVLLMPLAHAPALRMLHLSMVLMRLSADPRMDPSVIQLSALMLAAPRLHTRMHVIHWLTRQQAADECAQRVEYARAMEGIPRVHFTQAELVSSR